MEKMKSASLIGWQQCLLDRNSIAYQSNQMTRTIQRSMSTDESDAVRTGHFRSL